MSPAARPPPWVVHLLARDDEHVRPVCGDWRKSPNWTTEPSVVTCPDCTARATRGGNLDAADVAPGPTEDANGTPGVR